MSDSQRRYPENSILGGDVILALGIVATILIAAAVTFVGDVRETLASRSQGTVLQQDVGVLERRTDPSGS